MGYLAQISSAVSNFSNKSVPEQISSGFKYAGGLLIAGAFIPGGVGLGLQMNSNGTKAPDNSSSFTPPIILMGTGILAEAAGVVLLATGIIIGKYCVGPAKSDETENSYGQDDSLDVNLDSDDIGDESIEEINPDTGAEKGGGAAGENTPLKSDDPDLITPVKRKKEKASFESVPLMTDSWLKQHPELKPQYGQPPRFPGYGDDAT